MPEMDISLYFFIFLALFIGALVTWLVTKLAHKDSVSSLEAQNQILKEKIDALNRSYHELIESFKAKEFSETDLRDSLIKSQSENKHLLEKLQTERDEIAKLQRKFASHFENLATNIFSENSERLAKTNQERLNLVLNPLKEKIQAFEKKVEEKYRAQAVEEGILKAEIKKLAQLNLQMAEEAKNLTSALKSDNKAHGTWGEIILERVLESSGLIKGEEYIVQGIGLQLKDVDGASQKPDVIINLPEKKHLIIDAKVSLKAYELFASSTNEVDRERHLKQHVSSIKNHVSGLSDRYYQLNPKLNSPDFVLLFLPIEASLSLALQGADDIFSYAWDKKVVIVSPSTLLATLKTVSSIWQNEKQNRNALKIAEESGKLYDKFHDFVQDMEKVGKSLDNSNASFAAAMNKLSTGKGNLISKAEKIKKMGVSSKKSLEGYDKEKD